MGLKNALEKTRFSILETYNGVLIKKDVPMPITIEYVYDKKTGDRYFRIKEYRKPLHELLVKGENGEGLRMPIILKTNDMDSFERYFIGDDDDVYEVVSVSEDKRKVLKEVRSWNDYITLQHELEWAFKFSKELESNKLNWLIAVIFLSLLGTGFMLWVILNGYNDLAKKQLQMQEQTTKMQEEISKSLYYLSKIWAKENMPKVSPPPA